jgi:hypothetical protein
MKAFLVLMAVALLLFGCGTAAQQSGFYEHDSMYKNMDHLKFSWGGYKSPTEQNAQQSADQQWWGIDIPYIPGQ